jgi:hypothetical protein
MLKEDADRKLKTFHKSKIGADRTKFNYQESRLRLEVKETEDRQISIFKAVEILDNDDVLKNFVEYHRFSELQVS